MSRVIRVNGTGRASAAPDRIVLKIILNTRFREYATCMQTADERYSFAAQALIASGFTNDDIKTASFSINQEYDYTGKDQARTSYWECSHSLKVEFPLDIPRLKKILESLSGSGARCDVRVKFTVSDGKALQEAMLADAARNARQRAEILCSASGVKLGELQEINYSWGEINVFSPTEYTRGFYGDGACRTGGLESIVPDDVSLKDTATFTWLIE